MKKLISLALALTLMCSLLVPSLTAAEIEPRDSAYFHSYGTTLTAEDDGIIRITFSATGLQINNSIGVSTYQVQRLNDDGNWEAITDLLTGQTASGVFSYTYSRNFQGVPGETYRVQVTFICSRSDGSETKAYTSGRITAKRYA